MGVGVEFGNSWYFKFSNFIELVAKFNTEELVNEVTYK